MPRSKRRALTGRGPVGKAVVAGAKGPGDQAGRRAVRGEHRQGHPCRASSGSTAAPGAIVYTDEAGAYRGIAVRA